MTNDTLELLETIACERQQALDRTDPEQRALEQEYRTQWAAFLREHRHNRRLRQEVLRNAEQARTFFRSAAAN